MTFFCLFVILPGYYNLPCKLTNSYDLLIRLPAISNEYKRISNKLSPINFNIL